MGDGPRRSRCTVFFAATAPLLSFSTPPGYLVEAPAAIVNHQLVTQSGALGTGTFVALAALFLGITVSAGLLVLPRRPFALAVYAFLLVFCILATRAGVDRALASSGPSKRPFAGPSDVTLDWVDAVLPHGATAAIVPFPTSEDFRRTALLYWDVEFWNGSVVRTFVAPDGNFSYAPFPNEKLAPDWKTGLVPGSADAPQFVIFAAYDPHLILSGPRHAENLGLRVILADRPYHASWMTRRLDTDGWMRPGRPATVRVFSPGGERSQLVTLQITMGASQMAHGPVRDPGSERPPERRSPRPQQSRKCWRSALRRTQVST